MSNDLLFAVTIFLGGAWYLILGQIHTITAENSSDITLMVLSIMHYVLSIYLVLSLLLFFRRGLRSLGGSDEKSMESLGTADALLFGTWPAAAGAVLVVFVVTRFSESTSELVLEVGFPVALAAFFIVLYHKTRRQTKLLRASTLAWFAGIAACGFIVYILVMSFLFAGVKASTDQEYYEPGAVARVTVQTTGYVFLPFIEEMEILGTKYERTNMLSNELSVSHRLPAYVPNVETVYWGGPNYGQVTYRLQAIGLRCKGYFPIRFRQKDPA